MMSTIIALRFRSEKNAIDCGPCVIFAQYVYRVFDLCSYKSEQETKR